MKSVLLHIHKNIECLFDKENMRKWFRELHLIHLINVIEVQSIIWTLNGIFVECVWRFHYIFIIGDESFM